MQGQLDGWTRFTIRVGLGVPNIMPGSKFPPMPKQISLFGSDGPLDGSSKAHALWKVALATPDLARSHFILLCLFYLMIFFFFFSVILSQLDTSVTHLAQTVYDFLLSGVP